MKKTGEVVRVDPGEEGPACLPTVVRAEDARALRRPHDLIRLRIPLECEHPSRFGREAQPLLACGQQGLRPTARLNLALHPLVLAHRLLIEFVVGVAVHGFLLA